MCVWPPGRAIGPCASACGLGVWVWTDERGTRTEIVQGDCPYRTRLSVYALLQTPMTFSNQVLDKRLWRKPRDAAVTLGKWSSLHDRSLPNRAYIVKNNEYSLSFLCLAFMNLQYNIILILNAALSHCFVSVFKPHTEIFDETN